jgi:glycerol-3-phosphate dehydrogenase (NAD(P)+)
MKKHIAILGAGNMGTALAVIAAKAAPVVLWSVEADVVEAINDTAENPRYLPGIRLGKHVRATGRLVDAVVGAQMILVAVPSHVMASVAHMLAPLLKKTQIVVNVAKGVDETTLEPMVAVLRDALPRGMRGRVATLSGPSIANEFATDLPCAVTIAATTRPVAETVCRALRSAHFRATPSTDVLGTALGGTLKNMYALGLGMVDGLRFGMNAKAAMLTIALQELRVLFQVLGAKPESAFVLSGVGDLIVTGMSEHSRNRRFGEEICLDASCRIKMKDPAQTIEGVKAVAAVAPFARKKKLSLPLLFAIERVLFRNEDPKKALDQFFSKI